MAEKVIEVAGIWHHGHFLWMRQERILNATLARTILKQAKADETYEGEPPEDDAKAVEEAESLVKMAQDAWDQNIRGPQVESILRLAAEGENGDVPASEPAEAESPPPKEEEKETPSSESQQTAPAEEEQVADSLKLSDEDIARYKSEEPWENYDKEKVSEIVEAVEIGMEADDDPEDLLGHVWTYESSHKNRVRILRKLEEIGAAHGYAQDEEEASASALAEDDAGEGETAEEAEEAGPGEAAETAEETVEPEPESGEESTDDYRDLMVTAEREVVEQRSHVPPAPPKDEDFDLPFDYTTLSDKQLQMFYGIYTALAYHTNYRVLVEEARARACREAATELANNLLVNADKYDDHDKQKTMTILEAEVNSDENVKLWKKRQRKHEAFAHAFKNERDGYNKIVESLSRLETMRHNEFERSGGKTGRR